MNNYVNSKSSVGGVSNSSTLSLTFTANAAATGSTLIAWIHATSAVDYITGLHDNNGGTNTWGTPISKIADPANGEWTYGFLKYLAPGTTVTSVTMESSSAANAFIHVVEVAGLLSAGAFEAFYNTTTDPVQQLSHATSFVTANPNDFALIGVRSGTSFLGTPTGVTAGYTMLANGRGGSDVFYNNDLLQPGAKSLAFTSGVTTQCRYFVYLFRAAVTDPTVSTVTGSSVNEGTANRFTVALSGATNRTTDYSLSFGGTAVAGTDYSNDFSAATFSTGSSYVPGVGVRMLTGYSSFTCDVTTTDNLLDQADRTLVLLVNSVASTGGLIVDNDPAPSITLSDAVESFGVLSFDATMNTASGKSVTFNYASADGTKTAGTDYQNTSGAMGFNPGDPLRKQITVSTYPAPAPQVLRFVSPYNNVTEANSVAAATTYLAVRARVPFLIGSGDLSQIVLAFGAWNLFGGTINYLGNAYTIVSCSIEKDGGAYAPVTFSASRSAVVADGTAELLSDALLPSAFGQASFVRGTKFWIRVEYSVASAGLKLPQGKLTATQWGTGASGRLLSAGNDCSPVDGTGAMTSIVFASTFANPYVPIVLGKFVSGDPKTFIGIGDSILGGYLDDAVTYPQKGSFSKALTDADFVSNPIGGANFGYTGSTAALWTGTNSSILVNYLKYAKYAVDEYQTNKIAATNGNLAAAKTEIQALWSLLAGNGITTVLRLKLNPRCANGTDGTATYGTAWTTGGDALAFNDWLDTALLGVAQGVTLHVLAMFAVRLSQTQSQVNFYRWLGATVSTLGGYTSDGTHPNAAGHVLQAPNFRAAFGVLN